ncbi:MAG: purine-nucleoside phosphorylase [Clostridia bacterium]|nr:purine-nucleoside phosphorylase [Clostridia bacterium]
MYREAAAYIMNKTNIRPELGLVLGTGLNPLADAIEDAVIIPFEKIPHFPVSTVHAGNLVIGTLRGKSVVCMQGRVHYYEGYTMRELGFPVQVMHAMGVKTLLLTNASGGICETYFPGQVVAISDHIKLDMDSPLRGENPDSLGSRFFDMSTAYTPELLAFAQEVAKELDYPLCEGVYAYMGGPQFETPAEIRMLRIMGADLVGMSTVPEVIAAAHCGIKVLALSCVTNMAAGMDMGGFNESVIADAEVIGQKTMLTFLEKAVEKL